MEFMYWIECINIYSAYVSKNSKNHASFPYSFLICINSYKCFIAYITFSLEYFYLLVILASIMQFVYSSSIFFKIPANFSLYMCKVPLKDSDKCLLYIYIIHLSESFKGTLHRILGGIYN